MSAVRKAVIAAAGLGTRFLPQTKAIPKEMLPIIDKPVIQHVVEELIDAGVEDIVIVTGPHKRTIEDHFDVPSPELVRVLAGTEDKAEALRLVEEIARLANFVYIRQKGPMGNGTPLLNAARVIGDEPFIYAFGDDFIKATPGRFRQMVDVYERTGVGVLSCVRTSRPEDYSRYGFVAGRAVEPGIVEIASIVEKPGLGASPSDLASVSSYLFPPEFFDYLSKRQRELVAGEELSLQVAIQRFLDDGNRLLACEIANARYYDAGDKLEYLKTIIDLGLAHPDIGPDLRSYMRQSLAEG